MMKPVANRKPSKKRRRRAIIAFEMIRLDRMAAEPLHQQLYRQIRDELISGSFSDSSSRLPSSRALAVDLGISRLTVNLAFEKLHAEGYLRARVGSGTFVADSLPETFLSPGRPRTQLLVERPPRLSDRVRNLSDKRVGKQFDFGIAGPPGVSFVPLFPRSTSFRSKFGNDSEHKSWQKRALTCSSTHRAAGIQTCARQLQLIYAIIGVRAVIRIRS